MGFLNKIKNALFEEEEVEQPETEELVRKVDVERTINNEEIRIKHYDEEEIQEEPKVIPQRETKPSPIIFDVEDFVEEQPEPTFQKPIKQEQKILYGGYTAKVEERVDTKEKFQPSPVISPVYGILDTNYVAEIRSTDERKPKSIDNLFVEDRKKKLDLDTVRQKAYGGEIKEVKEEKSLLYEMENIDDKPGIEKLTLGDAEEYFEDLGLEYNVDYKDMAKEKRTRTIKNKVLTEEVEEEIKETLKNEKELNNNINLMEEQDDDNDEIDEKNLYDLIDMMYDNNKE